MTRSANRRRPAPWLHRWSRPLIGGVATLGALVTGYLTISHQVGSQVACGASGSCDTVLSSPYASLFGLPLSLFGCLAYVGMIGFALSPLLLKSPEAKEQRSRLEEMTWLLLFAGATGMVIFSGYLMFLLATVIKTLCIYCIASACFTALMFILTLLGREWRDIGNLFFIGLIVGLVTVVGSLGLYSMASAPSTPTTLTLEPTGPREEGVGWVVTTTSGEAELQLAQHLQQSGAKAYMGWTCSHCYAQKQLFGKEAVANLSRVECVEEGRNYQPQLCTQAQITAFPTWIINGKSYTGVKSLNRLANLSGYTGPRNFKNFPEIQPKFPD
jgi:uncharacterized membrane protein